MIIDQFAGVRNDIPTERFSPNDLVEATNLLLNNSNQLERRTGAVEVVSNAFHSLWADGDICYAVNEDTLYRIQSDYSTIALVSGLVVDAPMSFAICDGRVYYCNGYDKGIIESDDSARTWGMTTPGGFSSTSIAGLLHAGTYQYALAYLRGDGQESGITTINTHVLASEGGIEFTDIPISSDADVTGKILYLSTADGEMLYEAGVIAASATQVSLTDVDLSDPSETIFACEPPDNGHLVAEYFGHMLYAVGSFLYHSKTYGPELFDQLEYYPFESRITMIAPTSGGVFVGTETETLFLSGGDPAEWRITIKANYGVIEGTLAYSRSGLLKFEGLDESVFAMWQSRQGVCAGLPDGSIFNLTDPRYQTNSTVSRGAGIVRNVGGSTYYHSTV